MCFSSPKAQVDPRTPAPYAPADAYMAVKKTTTSPTGQKTDHGTIGEALGKAPAAKSTPVRSGSSRAPDSGARKQGM